MLNVKINTASLLALDTSRGKKEGYPLGTRRRTLQEEPQEAGKTWLEVSWLVEDRIGWRTFLDALCSIGRNDDNDGNKDRGALVWLRS